MGVRPMMTRSSRPLVGAALLCCLAAMVEAADIKTVSIEGLVTSQQVPLRDMSLKVHLNGGLYSAIVRKDKTFSIPDVPVASAYLLEVISNTLVWEQVRLSITKTGSVRATRMNVAPNRKDTLAYPLRLEPIG